MCRHVRSASASRRRCQPHRKASPVPPVAVLDLGKPAERSAHEFLLRGTSGRDRLWKMLDMRRHGATLLCVVLWVHPENVAKPFSLADVSLTRTAVCWRDYATADDAYTEMK